MKRGSFQKSVEKSTNQAAVTSFNDRGLVRKLTVAGIIVSLFSVVAFALLFVQDHRENEADAWLARTRTTIDSLGKLSAAARQQYEWISTAVKLKSDRSSFQAQLEASDQNFNRVLNEYLVVSGGGPTHIMTQKAISETYGIWKGDWEKLLRSSSYSKTSSYQKYFEDLSEVLATALEKEKKFLQVRIDQEYQARQQTYAFVFGIGVVLVLLTTYFLVHLYLTVVKPIRLLTTATKNFESGILSTRVKVSGRNELGLLQLSFNGMADKIEELVTDLRSMDEAKSEFLSSVSHELRTPLTSISGYVRLLMEGEVGNLSSTQKEFLSIVDTNIGRLSSLINDILDIEKISSGNLQLIKEPSDLTLIIKECIETFEVVARQKGLEFEYQLPSESALVLGDRIRLVQVFMNLISNAVKYTEKGKIFVTLEKRNMSVVVSIKDTGFGIAPEDRENLFKKFYRTQEGIRSGQTGTGLGLAITKDLTEAHEGNIRVKSQLGEGSEFLVTLPLLRDADVISLNERRSESDFEEETSQSTGARSVNRGN